MVGHCACRCDYKTAVHWSIESLALTLHLCNLSRAVWPSSEAWCVAQVFDVFRDNQVSVDVVATSEISVSLTLDQRYPIIHIPYQFIRPCPHQLQQQPDLAFYQGAQRVICRAA